MHFWVDEKDATCQGKKTQKNTPPRHCLKKKKTESPGTRKKGKRKTEKRKKGKKPKAPVEKKNKSSAVTKKTRPLVPLFFMMETTQGKRENNNKRR